MQDEQVVLLVEDNPAHAEIIRRIISVFKISVRLEHVADGQTALDYLQKHKKCDGVASEPQSPQPRLVLLDLRMPKMTGIEILKAIKTDPELMHIPVIMLTTSSADTDLRQAYAHHANSYLVKPDCFKQTIELIKALSCYWLKWNVPSPVCHE